ETCLALNVVRPASVVNETFKLLVVDWIHGDAFSIGSGCEEQYNTSFLVSQPRLLGIGKPIIAVTTTYSLSAWGFLYSLEGVGTGNTNVGLRDQHQALQRIQENIATFGGNP
ncbi:hypothetical protein M441DRAFT_154211, partial [Trichoderma asperellum CBS 433.97]